MSGTEITGLWFSGVVTWGLDYRGDGPKERVAASTVNAIAEIEVIKQNRDVLRVGREYKRSKSLEKNVASTPEVTHVRLEQRGVDVACDGVDPGACGSGHHQAQ
jgi:hypothetical protein